MVLMTFALMLSAAMFANRKSKYDPASDTTDSIWYEQALVTFNDLLFIASHWIFVYYYLKVAFTIPVYFECMTKS